MVTVRLTREEADVLSEYLASTIGTVYSRPALRNVLGNVLGKLYHARDIPTPGKEGPR
jgi:hypothetical protein